MKKTLIPFAILPYLAAVIIASAGAINYAFTCDAHIYTIAGVFNLIFGGWTIWKVWKSTFKIDK